MGRFSENIISNIHTFQICQDKECVPSGSIFTFGYKEQPDPKEKISKKNQNITYDNVTELVESKKWTPEQI